MSRRPYVFTDTETTGLSRKAQPWEIALIVRRESGDEELLIHAPVDLVRADAAALDIGGFWDRHPDPYGLAYWVNDQEQPIGKGAARGVHHALRGATLVGANPAFDARILSRWLGACGLPRKPWHYRLLDIEAYAAGALGWDEPRSLSAVCEALGVVNGAPHTAMGDARAVRDCCDAIRARQS